MNIIIQEMLDKYRLENVYEKKNAIKEIMQEIVLYGLSKAGFFKDAAFYALIFFTCINECVERKRSITMDG